MQLSWAKGTAIAQIHRFAKSRIIIFFVSPKEESNMASHVHKTFQLAFGCIAAFSFGILRLGLLNKPFRWIS